MAKLIGTVIANEALERTGTEDRKIRLYTQKRTKDRSHKIYGYMNKKDTEALILELTRLGASNVRAVPAHYYNAYSSGVRFETWEGART